MSNVISIFAYSFILYLSFKFFNNLFLSSSPIILNGFEIVSEKLPYFLITNSRQNECIVPIHAFLGISPKISYILSLISFATLLVYVIAITIPSFSSCNSFNTLFVKVLVLPLPGIAVNKILFSSNTASFCSFDNFCSIIFSYPLISINQKIYKFIINYYLFTN